MSHHPFACGRRSFLVGAAATAALVATGAKSTPAAASASSKARQRIGWSSMEFAMDRGTDRPMPVRLLCPDRPTANAPLIAFSHGAASSGGAYDEVLTDWAQRGYVIVAPTHSDSRLLSPNGLSRDEERTERVADIQRLLDGETMLSTLLEPRGITLDPEQRAVAGHSYGGMIAAIFGGAIWGQPRGNLSPQENRLRAVVAISPPGKMPSAITGDEYATLETPCLVTTGTQDIALTPGAHWSEHLFAYRRSLSRPAYALIGEGVDHYFGGLICRGDLPGPPQWDALADLQDISRLFLDAMLGRSDEAQAKLDRHAGGAGLRTSTLEMRK